MATIASLIVQIAADTSALVRNIELSNEKLDDFSNHAVGTIAMGSALGDAFEHIGERILDTAVDAVKRLGEEIVKLTLQGSHVNDVEAGFERLTSQAGLLGSTLLDTLRSGTHNTIDDFVLMKQVNQDLAAGMNLTNDQFGLVAQSAYALAKVTGGDEATAFETINNALETGRVKALALLTGKIDLKDAELKYADAIGSTTEDLTAEQKLEADRQAILHALQGALARVGDQQDSLADKVQQGATWWANFEDEIGKTLATSPALIAALNTISTSLLQAFGGDRQAVIHSIAEAVKQVAIVVVDLGIGATAMATVVVTAWSAIKTVVLGVETAIVGIVDAIGEAFLAAEKLAGKLHLVDPTEVQHVQDSITALRAMTVSLAEQTAEAARGVIGQSQLQQQIDKVGGALFQTRDALLASSAATEKATTATDAHTVSQTKTTAAVRSSAEAVGLITKLWDEYYGTIIKQTGTALDQQIAAIDKWYDTEYTAIAKLAEKHTQAWQALDALNAAYFAKQQGALVDFNKVNSDSADAFKRTLDSVALRAQANLDFVLAHTDQFRADSIAKYQAIADGARMAADNWFIAWNNKIDLTDTALGKLATDAVTTFASVGKAGADSINTIGDAFDGLQVKISATAQQMDQFYTDIAKHANVGIPGPGGVGIPVGASAGNPAAVAGRTFDLGGPVFGDGPAIVHDGEYVVPKGGALVRNGSGGDTIIVHAYVSGVWDLTAANQAADAIGKAMLRRSGRKFGTA